MKKLIKSYKFWTALAGAVGLLAVSIAKIFGFTISSSLVEELIMAICGVLVVFGIVKKPNKKEQSDETEQTEIAEQVDDKEQTEIAEQVDDKEQIEIAEQTDSTVQNNSEDLNKNNNE